MLQRFLHGSGKPNYSSGRQQMIDGLGYHFLSRLPCPMSSWRIGPRFIRFRESALQQRRHPLYEQAEVSNLSFFVGLECVYLYDRGMYSLRQLVLRSRSRPIFKTS